MRSETANSDIDARVRLLCLVAYSILTVALMAATLGFEWELWVVPVMAVGLVVVWYLYIAESVEPHQLFRLYSLFLIVEFFYYGVHPTSLFDLPVTLFLIVALFSVMDEKKMIGVALGTYFLLLVYHFFIIGTIDDGFGRTEWARLGLDIITSILATFLGRSAVTRRDDVSDNFHQVIEELETVNRSREDFLTNVSHELRTPINAVTGISSVMLEKEDDTEKHQLLSSIHMAGEKLASQIGDVLDYTELDTNRLIVGKEPYSITSMMSDLMAEMYLYERENLELIFDIDATTPSVLMGDEYKIRKIIRHLVDNALKFTKEGGAYVHIFPIKKEYGINLCIQVADTGIGIAEDDIEKIYGQFYQANATRTRSTGGMGLGLSIVNGFVKEMGGFMLIKQNQGGGTIASISIPQEVANAAPCMSVENPEALCIAIYINPNRWGIPQIRDYYGALYANLSMGLGVKVLRAINMREMQYYRERYNLTHIFVGSVEYMEAREFFDTEAKRLPVTIVAEKDYSMRVGTDLLLIKKPLSTIPPVNILNHNYKDYTSNEREREKRMYFPNTSALVVDDEKMNLMVAKGILSEYGMDVTCAGSGLEALELYDTHHYDLIFMDHMMPEMDGVETTHRLRQAMTRGEKESLIVALTANAVSGAREMFLREGFDEFIAKPMEQIILERTLKKIMPASTYEYRDIEDAEKKKRTQSSPGAENVTPTMTEEHRETEDGGRQTVPKEADAAQQPTAELPQTDVMSRLRNEPIDFDTAMKFCLDDEEFYLEVLRNFLEESDEKIAELKRLYADGDYANYQIKTHALKTTAKTVGLMELSELALSIESALKEGDRSVADKHHEDLDRDYTDICTHLKDVVYGG